MWEGICRHGEWMQGKWGLTLGFHLGTDTLGFHLGGSSNWISQQHCMRDALSAGEIVLNICWLHKWSPASEGFIFCEQILPLSKSKPCIIWHGHLFWWVMMQLPLWMAALQENICWQQNLLQWGYDHVCFKRDICWWTCWAGIGGWNVVYILGCRLQNRNHCFWWASDDCGTSLETMVCWRVVIGGCWPPVLGEFALPIIGAFPVPSHNSWDASCIWAVIAAAELFSVVLQKKHLGYFPYLCHDRFYQLLHSQ